MRLDTAMHTYYFTSGQNFKADLEFTWNLLYEVHPAPTKTQPMEALLKSQDVNIMCGLPRRKSHTILGGIINQHEKIHPVKVLSEAAIPGAWKSGEVWRYDLRWRLQSKFTPCHAA